MNKYDSRPDTITHIQTVRKYICKLISAISDFGYKHDKSKLSEPELSVFNKVTPKLAKLTYGSDEYKEQLKEMDVALKHHYECNPHHPEHWENGIKDMDLVCICEMLADWKAASERHDNGDIYKSIEINQKRFGYSDELASILKNTVKRYFEIPDEPNKNDQSYNFDIGM